MQRAQFLSLFGKCAAAVALTAGMLPVAQASGDVLKVGVFPSSAALPFYIAVNRGYFKEAGLEVQEVPMTSHPLTVQAIVSKGIDAAVNLVTLEGANIESRRAGTLKYISLNGQNSEYVIEQFVVRTESGIQKLSDIKNGTKLLSAPGPANIGAARAVLKKVGLEEGKDFSIQEQPIGMHSGALRAGTFEAGYTLEPAASVMVEQKIARRLESGVIATHLLGSKQAYAFAAGAVVSGDLLKNRPDVAKRFAQAWERGVKDAFSDSSTRGYLIEGMKVPPALAASVPLPRIVMAKDLSAAHVNDFQKFLDIGQELSVIKTKVTAQDLLQAY